MTIPTVSPRPRVGIVGGGQLARMTTLAALPLGVSLTVLDPNPLSPALEAGARLVPGDPTRLADLVALARLSDVVTLDHERVPIAHLRALEDRGVRLAPGSSVAELALDKASARRRLADAGFPVPGFAVAHDADEIEAAARQLGWPVVVKQARGGYDGRGVAVVPDRRRAEAVVRHFTGPLVVEELVPFSSELAVLVARNASGDAACYPPVSTVQRNGTCVEVVAPALVAGRVVREASVLAIDIAHRFDLVGVMALELFVVDDRVIVNEVATRPHNTAHHTIEASETSQFEQHLRAVLDWPLGSTALRSPAAMCNVLGVPDGPDPRTLVGRALGVPGAHVHLYGKAPQPGRKLGHVTGLAPTVEQARQVARRAAALLVQPDPRVTTGDAA